MNASPFPSLPRSRPIIGFLLLLLLVALCVLRSWIGTRLDSLTVDEPWHIVAGTAYARTGDFHLNPEHPPLVKLWVGHAGGSPAVVSITGPGSLPPRTSGPRGKELRIRYASVPQ